MKRRRKLSGEGASLAVYDTGSCMESAILYLLGEDDGLVAVYEHIKDGVIQVDTEVAEMVENARDADEFIASFRGGKYDIEDAVSQFVYSDDWVFEMCYENFKNDLQEVLDEKNAMQEDSLPWSVSSGNMGWRSVSGEAIKVCYQTHIAL